jgi:hypothetical protein
MDEFLMDQRIKVEKFAHTVYHPVKRQLGVIYLLPP